MKHNSEAPQKLSKAKLAWEWTQFFGSIFIVLGVMLWLLFAPKPAEQDLSKDARPQAKQSVEVVDGETLRIETRSPLFDRLEQVTVQLQTTSAPILQTSGRVIASRRPAQDKTGSPFWQFSNGELLDSYTAWQKAKLEAEFAETQLIQVKELASTREEGLQKALDRLEKLVKSGTETEKSVSDARTLLLQTRIEDRKSIFDAEVVLKTAQRQSNNEFLKLQQFGIDPELLSDATTDMDIVTAEVPEAMVGMVAIGQNCNAQFYGIPGQSFEGKVSSLAPVLNAEQRTLRLLFIVRDPEDLLRPGMFARIGVGTDARQTVQVPSDAVLHVGNDDVILVVKKDIADSGWAHLSIRTLACQEQVNSEVEVRGGISVGETVIAKNAILLKPLIARAIAEKQSFGSMSPEVAE